MLPLYRPVSERTASERRDADAVQTEPLVFFTAHVFALPVRRVALAVSLIRAELAKPEAERTANYLETKAEKLLAASAYFPQT